MNTLNKILLALIILLIVALGALVYVQKGLWEKPYYAVYLSTGDLYFGQLAGNYLSNALLLQQSDKNGTQSVVLSEFKKAFWGPDGGVALNPEQIVWKAKLGGESQIIEFIKNGLPYGGQIPQGTGATSTLPDAPGK